MKTLYLECNMGAAGDMLAAALLELHPAKALFVRRLNELGLAGVRFCAQRVTRCGVAGTHLCVTVNGAQEESGDAHHHGEPHGHTHTYVHRGLHEIAQMVQTLAVPPQVRRDILAVYQLIADAESKVHGAPVEEIHFHELGTMDALADITAVCLLIYELSPENILSSPVCVGSGQVRCAHGIVPVPAPATAALLRGIPTYAGDISAELCTPTGAALLRYFVTEFVSQPVMRVEEIGYGCGAKEFAAANCVRAMLGQTERAGEQVAELRCNLDDMTPEAVGFAVQELFAAGALDVFTAAVGMKKNRPGVLLVCVCRLEQRDEMLRLLFLHTTTLGVRESVCSRYTLTRQIETRPTPYGEVRVKRASGWGVEREKAEYDDLARIAREQKISLSQAAALVRGQD